MEFAIRLDDKINIQVFCHNVAHKGNHMDRFFYEDDTFEAPCPVCGDTGEWLYRKNNAISKKGHPLTYKPDGWSWGSNELKHFGFVRIDCTEEQAKELCEGIVNEQAMADAKDFKILANARRTEVINNTKSIFGPVSGTEELKALKEGIKSSLEFDTQYQSLQYSERQSENRANVDARPCKQKFDFEKVLSVDELAGWNDMGKYSEVIDVEFNTATINMKAIE